MKIVKANTKTHAHCECWQCRALSIYPDLPSLDPPMLTDVYGDTRAHWTVACNWLGPLVDGKATLIRRGFRTDGTSIPRVMWRALGHPFMLPVLAYSLPHDADYAAELFPREEADARFLNGMAQDKHVGYIKRNAIWAGVRVGGGAVWNKHSEKSILDAQQYCRVVFEPEYQDLCESRIMPNTLTCII